jgi:hypothetical protein
MLRAGTTTRILALLVVMCAAGTAAASVVDYDADIERVHTRAGKNRADRLASYTFGSYAPAPATPADLDTAIAVMFLNTNKTAVAHADTVLKASIGYYWQHNNSRSYGSSFMCILVRAFALFNQRSQHPQLGRMSAPTDRAFQQFFLDFLEGTAIQYTNETEWGVNVRRDSENIDTMRRTTAYISAATLALDPEHANHVLADGRTVAEHHTRWEQYHYDWTKWFATHGLFEELGSSYWPRTWGCVFNLLDLPPSQRVRTRAKLLVDICMVEAEQGSLPLRPPAAGHPPGIAAVRVGQKSRAKRDTSHEALPFTMYVNLSPQLYGMNLSEVAKPFDHIINQEANSYAVANVSVLMHLYGKSPETAGVFTLTNRMVGQANGTDFGFCPPPGSSFAMLCNDTGRSTPCQCAHNTIGIISNPPFNWPTTFLHDSRQINYIHTTPAYSMGGVVFSPNDFFVGGSQQRWTGLVFSNANSTTIGLRHLTGEKWALVHEDVMIAQKCATCNYGGDPLVDLYAPSKVWQERSTGESTGGSNWTFVQASGTVEGPAWAAVRPAWGNSTLEIVPIPKNGPMLSVIPQDPWAPLIIVAGRQADFADADAFVAAVLSAKLRVTSASWQTTQVSFGWRGKQHTFFPNVVPGKFRLPETDGKPVVVAQEKQYDGPHLNAALGADVVRTSYKSYVVEYDFKTDTIRRV